MNGKDPYGFGSSSVRGGYINPLTKNNNDSTLNINQDLIKVAADKVRELDIGSRGSQESLVSMGERVDRYISYRNKKSLRNNNNPKNFSINDTRNTKPDLIGSSLNLNDIRLSGKQ